MVRDFKTLFPVSKPVIGMIHLAGSSPEQKLWRALRELTVYEEEGLDAAIIENYYGEVEDVMTALSASKGQNFTIVRGINVLDNPYFALDMAGLYGAKFVQIDSVQTPDLNLKQYDSLREGHRNLVVLGGIGFKYTPPTGNSLEVDLRDGRSRCEAIVTTGPGTGVETPLEKLKQYREIMGDFPLISGAGVTPQNVYDQLQVVDGIIVGSYFKAEERTENVVERQRVKSLMNIVRQVREEAKA